MTRFSSLLPLGLLASGSLLLASCGGGSSGDSSFGSDDSGDIIVEETPATITTALDKLETSVKAVEGSSTLSPANARKEITTLRKLINNANLSTTKKQELHDKVNALDDKIVETLEKRTSDAVAKAKADAEAAKAKAQQQAQQAEQQAQQAQQQLQQAQSLDATVVYNAYSADNGIPRDWRYNNPTIILEDSGQLTRVPGSALRLNNFTKTATNSWRGPFTRYQENPDGDVDNVLTQKALARYYGTTKGYKIFADSNFSDGVITTTFSSSDVKGVSQFSNQTLTESGDTFTRSGTYKGVGGNYICTADSPGASCTYSKDPNTEAITLAGSGTTWTFDPGNDNTRITIDPEYVSYGWWMTRDKDGEYRVGAFTSGIGKNNDNPVTAGPASIQDALTGTATYVGEAHGIYAIKGGALTTNTGAGEFKARATLTANFDNNDTISGKINSFNAPNSSNWEVELHQTTIDSNGTFTNDSSGTTWFIGTSNAPKATDKYTGTLYINGARNVDGNNPLLGTGAFTASFGDQGKMVGAFGVKLQGN